MEVVDHFVIMVVKAIAIKAVKLVVELLVKALAIKVVFNQGVILVNQLAITLALLAAVAHAQEVVMEVHIKHINLCR